MAENVSWHKKVFERYPPDEVAKLSWPNLVNVICVLLGWVGVYKTAVCTLISIENGFMHPKKCGKR